MFGRPVEPPTVTLDQESFRALASEVRVEILKRLDAKRMTVTDLSNALSLSKPTLLEHLERLQSAGLVKRVDEGRKWIYYELTGKSRKVLHPERVQIVVALSSAILMLAAGAAALIAGLQGVFTARTAEPAVPNELAAFSSYPGGTVLLGVVLLVLAMLPLLIAVSLARRGRRRTLEPTTVPQ